MQRCLFHGSSHVLTFVLSEDERRKIDTLTRIMQEEFLSTDHLQDEMLRVLLKRFIILCTRIAEDRQGAVRENSLQFETIRKFYVLVDTYFKEKKQVQEYADMLNKSPKTLANILPPISSLPPSVSSITAFRQKPGVYCFIRLKALKRSLDARIRRPGCVQPFL